MTVSEIKNEAVLLTINCYFVISEPEKIKDKRVSVQLSDVAESIMRNVTPKGDHRLSQRYSELYLNKKHNYR